MKNSFFKYVFFIFAIGIIIFAIYKINNKQEKINDTNLETIIEEEEIVTELKLGIAEFDNINPILSGNKYVQDISKIIFNSLVTINEEYKIEPDLATEWAKTGATEYLIKLRKDVKWSDGTEFTAYDVLYTIDRLKEVQSIYSYNVKYVNEVSVIDKATVKIKLSQEVPFFEYNLIFPIMSKNYYGNDNFSETEKNNMPIGTNMYKISDIQDGKILLTKNENWYKSKEEQLAINKITINKYLTIGEMYNAFKLGQIDLVNTNNMEIEQYIGSIGYGKKEYKGREHTFIAINMQNEILSKIEVRQAIKYSINKEEIISSLYNNKYYKSSFPLDYGNWLNSTTKDEFSTEKANKILAENGWEYKYNYWRKTENYRTIKLNFNLVVKASNYKMLEIAEKIKTQLEAIGIKITITKANDNQYSAYLGNKNYDIILCSINQSVTPDLSIYFGENNISNYINADSINIVNELKNITDEKILKEKYGDLTKIYKNETPYISLFNNYSIVAYNSKLVGNITPNWYNIFYNINGWHK